MSDREAGELPHPRERIFCSRCARKDLGKYRKDSVWFSLFYIPLIPIHSFRPYLSCAWCAESVNAMGGLNKCEKCELAVSAMYNHCPDCGGKTGVERVV